MKKSLAWVAATLLGCSSDGSGTSDDAGIAATASGTGVESGTANPSTTGQQGTADADSVDPPSNVPKYDVAAGDTSCLGKSAGSYCDGQSAIRCGDEENVLDHDNCAPGSCLDGTGCVACLDGQFSCRGRRVMGCNTTAEAYWEELEVCDADAFEVCDIGLGACTTLAPIGDTTPTGVYYQYSSFDASTLGFMQVSDVDSYDNRIYFVAFDASSQLVIGVFDVTLLDSDADGIMEPNQHPNNPDAMGPVEERVFTYVETIPVANPGGLMPNVMELFALQDRIYYGGLSIMQLDLATHATQQIAGPPSWSGGAFNSVSFLGYDDVNDVWYSGNESARRVFQYDAETGTWGWSFQFPELAGAHMDGIEVVTDPSSGIPYVYVSDMTSDFIGQYRLDPELGWVQENLFEYTEAAGAAVEGFGYGALGHFWVGSLAYTFYELGGGDLTQYIDPAG